jgi:hypothetical protein
MTKAVEAGQQIPDYFSAAPGYATHEVLNQAAQFTGKQHAKEMP